MKKENLNLSEMGLIKKLCQPKVFIATREEVKLLSSLMDRGYVKNHDDGTLEVTIKGANHYCASL